MSTIYALSSGQPPAAIGIVRISGPDAGGALAALAGKLPESRRATLARIADPATGDLLDRALLLWFPGPGTATGEDLAEIHLHGGRAVVARVIRALEGIEGLCPAEPGAFTRRAFENGRIDLAEAEGLADLLFAETERQRQSAVVMAEGGLGAKVEEWQASLLGLAARAEALLDFSDEGDVADRVPEGLSEETDELSADIARFLALPSGDRLRDGVRVALAGPPNAGKSSLLNVLVGRNAAIVSPAAGTTRDLIEVPLAIEGRPYVFTDTAGLHGGTGDEIESMGMARARDAITMSDIVLWLDDVEMSPLPDRTIIVHARNDIAGRERPPVEADVSVSARTGAGIDTLVERLGKAADALLPKPGAIALNARHRALLSECVNTLQPHDDPLIFAENLRLARSILDRVTGRAGTEDMLDALFGRFCIGK